MIAYIIAGIILGPYASGLFANTEDTASLGEIGILLMMFFIGTEMEIPDRRSLLLKPVIAQAIKMLLCLLLAGAAGILLTWPLFNMLMLATLLLFNSTAVVSEYLTKNRELQTDLGRFILNILLLQDLTIAPILTMFQFIGHEKISVIKLIAAFTGCIIIGLLLRAARHRDLIRPAFLRSLKGDHELQVFLGGLLCLGFAVLAEVVGFSSAVGSFVAGLLIRRTPAFKWLEATMRPFKFFFIFLFFVSIGLRLDIPYITENALIVIAGTLLLLFINSLLSALTFRLLRYSWKQSIYGGALLSQTGEFGIVACSLAYNMRIVDAGTYKTAIAITELSLLFSTSWITITRQLFNKKQNRISPSDIRQAPTESH